jgi:hypothetical protein
MEYSAMAARAIITQSAEYMMPIASNAQIQYWLGRKKRREERAREDERKVVYSYRIFAFIII